jgi:hypothetical protein
MSNKQKQNTMENSICQITFSTSCKLRFVKGAKYIVSPMVGLPGIKLFRIYDESGNSFATNESHVNKFFKFI